MIRRNKQYVKLAIVVLFFAVSGLLIYLLLPKIQQSQTIDVNADTGQATIFIYPPSTTITKAGAVKVMATTTKPLAFAHYEVSFNPTLVSVKNITTTTALSRIVERTPLTNANRSGLLSITIALDPAQVKTPPSGNFELATIQMVPRTTAANTQVTFSINPITTQLVDLSANSFTTTVQNSKITLNPSTISESGTNQ